MYGHHIQHRGFHISLHTSQDSPTGRPPRATSCGPYSPPNCLPPRKSGTAPLAYSHRATAHIRALYQQNRSYIPSPLLLPPGWGPLQPASSGIGRCPCGTAHPGLPEHQPRAAVGPSSGVAVVVRGAPAQTTQRAAGREGLHWRCPGQLKHPLCPLVEEEASGVEFLPAADARPEQHRAKHGTR